jgi:DNA gyrase subunit A
VLPTQIPTLLVNGTNGIAVGMATNMAPHNLSECVDGIIAYIDNREITTQELMQYIKAPDFPTAGVIYGYEGVREAFETGRGRIVLRGETHFEEHNGHERIIATSIPYQVNKAEMIKKTADLVNEKKLEGLADIRDESDRKGIRVVYELKRDANPDIVLNKLFMMTPLQSSFNVNNVALVNGRPYTLNLKQLIEHFVSHRHEIILRRTRFELKKAEDRAHILEGLARAIDIVDEIIATIRACKGGTPEAKQAIMDKFGFDDPQASAIVAYRLGQLAGLEIKKIMDELDEIHERIKHFHEILQNEELQFQIIKDELLVIKEKYGDARRTQIVPAAGEFRMEDIIADDAVVITISHLGYIKRTPLTEYRVQSRGGKGSKGSATRDTDFIEHIFTATNHNHLLFFTEQGKCYKLRAFEIPEEGKNSKGRAIQNLLPLDKDNKVMAYLNVKSMTDEEYLENNYIILCTKKGIIKKTNLAAYKNVRQNGIIAVNIREDDQLLEACLTSGNDEVLMAVRSGKAVRFNEQTVRPMGRTATGVKAITLGSPDDEVIGMVCINDPQQTILVVSEKGFGKRSDIEDYRITNRGAKGVKTLNITDKTGDLIAIKAVTDDEDLMIINKSGIVIRMAVSKLRVMGRATQGVKLIDLRGTDEIAAVTKTEHEDEEEAEVVEPVETPIENNDSVEGVEGPTEEGETTLEQ